MNTDTYRIQENTALGTWSLEKGRLVPAMKPNEVFAPSFSCHCHPSNLRSVFHLVDAYILFSLVYPNGVGILIFLAFNNS